MVGTGGVAVGGKMGGQQLVEQGRATVGVDKGMLENIS